MRNATCGEVCSCFLLSQLHQRVLVTQWDCDLPCESPWLGQVRWSIWKKAMPAYGSLTQGWRSSKTSDQRWNLRLALADAFVPRNFIILQSPNQLSAGLGTVPRLLQCCSLTWKLRRQPSSVVCGGADPGAVQDQIIASCPAVTPLAEGQEGRAQKHRVQLWGRV